MLERQNQLIEEQTSALVRKAPTRPQPPARTPAKPVRKIVAPQPAEPKLHTGKFDPELVKEAAIIIVDLQIASRRTLKEKFGMRYSTIHAIMYQLERSGVVTAADEGLERGVLMSKEQLAELLAEDSGQADAAKA